VTSPREKKPPK